MSKIISFASDFGLEDGSVGVVKGVINRIDPELRINDISPVSYTHLTLPTIYSV